MLEDKCANDVQKWKMIIQNNTLSTAYKNMWVIMHLEFIEGRRVCLKQKS